MPMTENYNDILQDAGSSHHSVGSAWGLIIVLTVLLIAVSSIVHFL